MRHRGRGETHARREDGGWRLNVGASESCKSYNPISWWNDGCERVADLSGALRHREVQGVQVPTLVYGTAWKEDQTERLTGMAIKAGFRGVDTANQRRHYYEEGVGNALRAALAAGGVSRDEMFLQTKFTFAPGQDNRLPYDPRAPVGKQVAQSFESSLQHLGVDRLDSYVLHGPSRREGLSDVDWQAWGAMEEVQKSGRTRLLGVSNVSFGQLTELHARARVKPAVIQNRCFVWPKADADTRAFCKENGLVYQGFSLLTADRELLRQATVTSIARRAQVPAEVVVFRYALEVGMVVLTGTTSAEHMEQDLRVFEVEMKAAEAEAIERLVR